MVNRDLTNLQRKFVVIKSIFQSQLQIISRELNLLLHDDELVSSDDESEIGSFMFDLL